MLIHSESSKAVCDSVLNHGAIVHVLSTPANVRRLRKRCDGYEAGLYWRCDPAKPGNMIWRVRVKKMENGVFIKDEP